MLKIVLFMLLVSTSVSAQDPHFEMRKSWARTLKALLLYIEKKEGHKVVHEKNFLMRIQLISEAWADSRYDCFYAGWPSVKKGDLCQSPDTTNSSYNKSACKENQFQCQPLLFGKGKCVERQNGFANCEKASGGNYDFLKNLSRKEIEDMREMSLLADDVCKNDNSEVCQNVKSKLSDGLKSIDRAFEESFVATPDLFKSTRLVPRVTESKVHAEDCADPEHEHQKLAKAVAQVATKSVDDLYEKMKAEFEASPLCDPLKVINDPAERQSAVVLSLLTKELKDIDYLGNNKGPKEAFLQKLAERWKLAPETTKDVLPLLNLLKPYPQADDERRNLVARAKGIIIQDVMKNYRPDASMMADLKSELAENNIFTKNDAGRVECPFVSKDAFLKAMKGREEVLKRQGAAIKKKGQITIVDYTRPSNERRLFVIDLESNKVLHNTWVAHGGGGGKETEGKDKKGGSPEMSNVPGSLKSSDGFIIASQASYGNKYGNNVILKGIDSHNTNLQARAVVMHGWGSPMHPYAAGVEEYNFDTEKYDPPFDIVDKVKRTDFKNGTTKDMERTLNSLRSSVTTGPYLGATEGCLGVPMTSAKHLDRKGRNKTQLELLREDLPGSIIFNYSGPGMKSKYL